jgi:predicted nuclease of predicted toxin-antitoxin system
MIRLLTDENFKQAILHGLLRRLPHLDLLSVRDVGLAGRSDLFLLKWASDHNRTLLTHDKKTMTKYAKELLVQGQPMAGVILVPQLLPIGRAIDDLEILVECSSQAEMHNRIQHLPL